MTTPSSTAAPSTFQAFRSVPRTGVVYVTQEATARGYKTGNPEWSNLGQGQPETGPLPGAPPRVTAIDIDPADHYYAPVAGVWELREAVAALYNRLYRKGMPSQYTAENVAISGGGRAALTRVVASLDRVNLGHFLPDYTAYEELLDIFRLVSPTPILLRREQGYSFGVEDLRREVLGRGLAVILFSNPCNPMGKVVSGGELADWVAVGRDLDCTLLIDEFYSHYVWSFGEGEPGPMVSAARYVEDVDRDPVVIVDGLTKNWRYPGWRVTWTLGPRSVIETIESAGSFLDGGGSRPQQRAAVELMEPEMVLAEARAIRETFLPKRELMLRRVHEMGMRIYPEPAGTFYAFVSVRDLPEPLSDGMAFFRAALEHKVICVPGLFFDVNPGRRRAQRLSRFHQHVRLSFGPDMEEVRRGLDSLEEMIREARGRS
ncbi:MAG TPA: pyridoxal phosphate-dependent aminotransferase [Thermoanaerobaculia bacterium]|nr:pyridoxal phosphate-dependent aminotransferase [Thermoanaerobaculia bacterium]